MYKYYGVVERILKSFLLFLKKKSLAKFANKHPCLDVNFDEKVVYVCLFFRLPSFF